MGKEGGMKYFFLSLILIAALIVTGCATLKKATNIIKSDEQIAIDEAKAKSEKAEKDYKAYEPKEPSLILKMDIPAGVVKIPTTVVEARREYLYGKKKEVDKFKASIDEKIKTIEKEAKKASYFAVSLKGMGIATGIASTALVAASPANAVWVAGLGAFTTGALAFEGRAKEVGFSTDIYNKINDVVKEQAASALEEFEDINFEYLWSFASYASQEQWTLEMKKLGKAIIQLEIALRYTRSNFVLEVEKPKPTVEKPKPGDEKPKPTGNKE